MGIPGESMRRACCTVVGRELTLRLPARRFLQLRNLTYVDRPPRTQTGFRPFPHIVRLPLVN